MVRRKDIVTIGQYLPFSPFFVSTLQAAHCYHWQLPADTTSGTEYG